MANFKFRPPTYFWLDSWVLAHVIQLATQEFCCRFLNKENDPCGRQFDQMTQAARSGQANITEGCSRRETSSSTEMKLTDVARGSISELLNDYLNWIIRHQQKPWSIYSEEYAAVRAIKIEPLTERKDVCLQAAELVVRQKKQYDRWLCSSDSVEQAQCLLVLCSLLELMLTQQNAWQLENFKEKGSFAEQLTDARVEAKMHQGDEQDIPLCGVCGKKAIKKTITKGSHAGETFWSCPDWQLHKAESYKASLFTFNKK